MVRKKPKVATKYQRGANFERSVLKHLIGEPRKDTTGFLHELIGRRKIKVYGQRSAGSRGDFDLLIILSTDRASRNRQAVIGIQCKIKKPSMKTILKEVFKVSRKTRITTLYAWRAGRQTYFYPDLMATINEILEDLA